MNLEPIVTPRLTLRVLGPAELVVLLDPPASLPDYTVPSHWPYADERSHVERWLKLTEVDHGASAWRARAIVDAENQMVGHAGFHGPPVPADVAFGDPTYEGSKEPSELGVVEIGYMVFEAHRGMGYAVEAANGLIGHARASGMVDTVIACVAVDNKASHGVIAKLGQFARVGTCRDDDVVEVVYRRNL